jgi:hypothetical protein
MGYFATTSHLPAVAAVVTELEYERMCDTGEWVFDPRLRENRFSALAPEMQEYAWRLYAEADFRTAVESLGDRGRTLLTSFSPFFDGFEEHHADIRREFVNLARRRAMPCRTARRTAPRRRGAGRPRAQATRSSAASGDSGDDGPGEQSPASLRESGVPA